MSDGQKLLMKYLVSIGAPMDCTLLIVDSMWEENTLHEFFGYILEHQEANYFELYIVAQRIAEAHNTLNDYSMFETL